MKRQVRLIVLEQRRSEDDKPMAREQTMRSVEVYENVPDGSRLEVRVTSQKPAQDGNFTSDIIFITSGELDQSWPDADIHPGPKTATLRSPHAYMLEIRVAFLGTATAIVDARIFKPEGDIYSTPKTWTIPGNNGDQVLRVLFIRTA